MHNVNSSKLDPGNNSNEHLRLIFDDKDLWKQQRQLFAKTEAIKPVGLLESTHFTNKEGFAYATEQAIQRAQLIVERIWRAPENGPDEMRRVVKNLDRLSDTLCSVIDMAEFVRNVHPDESIMEAANNAYNDLCFYMNTLNTDTRMHKVGILYRRYDGNLYILLRCYPKYWQTSLLYSSLRLMNMQQLLSFYVISKSPAFIFLISNESNSWSFLIASFTLVVHSFNKIHVVFLI